MAVAASAASVSALTAVSTAFANAFLPAMENNAARTVAVAAAAAAQRVSPARTSSASRISTSTRAIGLLRQASAVTGRGEAQPSLPSPWRVGS